MSQARTDLDSLPPEARFAIRAVAAGLSFDDVDPLLKLDGPSARNALRAVVRIIPRSAAAPSGPPPPPRAAGDDALRAALAPALALAATPPGRASGTACPSTEIVGDLALGRLDGPLMLAEAEHAADCPACMARVVALRRAGPAASPAASAPSPARGIDVPLVVGALVGVGIVALWWFVI